MKIKKLIQYTSFLVLIIGSITLISCNFLSSNFNKSFTSYIYSGDLSKSNYLTTYYVKDKGNIPYISTANAYSLLGAKVSIEKKDDYIKYTKDNGAYVKFSSVDDTIEFNDYYGFIYENITDAIISPDNPYVKVYEDEIVKDVKSVTVDLKKYDIDILGFNKAFYIPFPVVNSIFLAPINYSFAFNGKDYYYVDNDVIYDDYGFLNKYGKSFFKSKENHELTEELAIFNYNELLFELDYCYGAKEYLGYENTADLIKDLDLEESLKSTNILKSEEAFAKLISSFNDPHSGFNAMSPYLIFEYTTSDKLKEMSFSTRSEKMDNRMVELAMQRNKSNYYQINGDVCFISFDEFILDFEADYNYFKPVTRDVTDDNFALFYLAFNEIKNNPKIKNIVIDLSLNGGGEVDSLVVLFTFLAGKYNIKFYDSLSKSTYVIPVQADINLDGVVDDEDDYSKYNYYILTDSPTFSCANSFVALAKDNNAATIIGRKTGGGASIINPACLVNGVSYNRSGMTCFYYENQNEMVKIDRGIEVDAPLLEDSYYNLNKLSLNLRLLSVYKDIVG